MTTSTLPVDLTVDFARLLDGRSCISASVGADGEAALLAVSQDDDARGWTEENPARDTLVLLLGGAASRSIIIPNLTLHDPLAQPLPSGEILVVGRKRGLRPDGRRAPNAEVFGPRGGWRRRFVAGDGISDLQVDGDGVLWIAYADEGVFGNTAWKRELGGLPPSGRGLAKLDSRGIILPQPFLPRQAGLIFHCYALNVAADGAWLYFYDRFPIVHVGLDGEGESWDTDVVGARALAVADDHVLLVGDSEDPTACLLAELGRRSLEAPRAFRLEVPLREGVPQRCINVLGRGPLLHLFTEQRWYTTDIRRLL